MVRARSLVWSAFLAQVFVAAAVQAQGAAPAQQQAPAVVSPEVHSDRRVTLRLRAPKATEVVVTGEITEGKPPVPMTKGANGIWTATLGPLPPDVYMYAFRVDSVNTPDPLNPYIKTVSGTGLASQVEVPGDGPQYYDIKPVPHGLVSILNYHSKALGVPRAAWVYTPPGYEQNSNQRYPVLYLLHGGGDTEIGWVLTGRANLILDNLIAEGRARPMVVVMPQGHVRQAMGVGPTATPTQGSTFEQDLLQDLMPEVERRFRVSTNPEERGMMGLSMGGGLTLRTGLNHLDKFRWIVGLSSAITTQGNTPAQQFASFLANPAAANQNLRLLHLTIGKDDALAGLVDANKAFSDALNQAGIRHTFRLTEGGHWWRVWRRDLYEIAPLLFQPARPQSSGAAPGSGGRQPIFRTAPRMLSRASWVPFSGHRSAPDRTSRSAALLRREYASGQGSRVERDFGARSGPVGRPSYLDEEHRCSRRHGGRGGGFRSHSSSREHSALPGRG